MLTLAYIVIYSIVFYIVLLLSVLCAENGVGLLVNWSYYFDWFVMSCKHGIRNFLLLLEVNSY